MFLGTWQLTLTPHGQFQVPLAVRAQLGTSFIVTAAFDPCLQLFPRAAWARFRAQVASLPIGLPSQRSLRRLIFSFAAELTRDRSGRISLPERLRRYAALEQRAVLVGNGPILELWAAERWQTPLLTPRHVPALSPTALSL